MASDGKGRPRPPEPFSCGYLAHEVGGEGPSHVSLIQRVCASNWGGPGAHWMPTRAWVPVPELGLCFPTRTEFHCGLDGDKDEDIVCLDCLQGQALG